MLGECKNTSQLVNAFHDFMQVSTNMGVTKKSGNQLET